MALSDRTKKSNIVYLVLEGGTKLCRALLLKRVEALRPPDMNHNWSLDQFLEKNRMKIMPNLNPASKNIVFPLTPSETNLEKWDVCVFCCVLKEACDLGRDLRTFLDQLKKIRNSFFHWSDSPIDDNKYEHNMTKLNVIFGKILDELNDDDLRSKINDMFNTVEAGEIPDDELSRILEAIDKTSDEIKDQVKHEHDDTRNFVSDQHLETRNVIIKGNKGMEEKLNTFIELFTSKFIEQSAKIKENAPEALGIEIGVRNCGNTEMEKSFTMMMVQLFNDEIRKVPDLSNLPSECHLKLGEIIRKICKSFEEKGYRIQNARQKCILLEIQCTSIIAFMRLYRDFIDGSLDAYFSELQTAVQSMDCFKDVCLETIMYEDDFLRTISNIDFLNILPIQKDSRRVDGDVNKSEHEDCDDIAHDTQSGNEKSNKILLQVIPGTRVEPQELERIIAIETKDLAQSYGLSFHTKILLGNFEEGNQQTLKNAAQVSPELNVFPDNENVQPVSRPVVVPPVKGLQTPLPEPCPLYPRKYSLQWKNSTLTIEPNDQHDQMHAYGNGESNNGQGYHRNMYRDLSHMSVNSVVMRKDDNENHKSMKLTGKGTGERSAKTKVKEKIDDIREEIFEYGSNENVNDVGVISKNSEDEKGTTKKNKIKNKKRVNNDKAGNNSPSIMEQEILSDLFSKLDYLLLDDRPYCKSYEKSATDQRQTQKVSLINDSNEKNIDSQVGEKKRREKMKSAHEINNSFDTVDENEVFKFLVKSLEGHGTSEEIKRKSGLFSAEFNALQWFRVHHRRFLVFGKDDYSCTVVAFCKQATYCKFYLNRRSCQRDCGQYHICKNMLMGHCKFGEKCPFSHDFLDQRNFKVSQKLGFSNMFTSDEICSLMKLRYPHVCQNWAETGSCNFPDCVGLHLCPRYLLGKCLEGKYCPLLHDKASSHNLPIIDAYGMSDWTESLLRQMIYISSNVADDQHKAGVLTEQYRPEISDDSVVEEKYLDRTDVLDIETSDLASKKYICEYHIIYKCRRPKCYNMHTCTKMPYLWQIRLFGRWTNLQNSEQVEKEYCACVDSAIGLLERHDNKNFQVSVMFGKDLTAVVNTSICKCRRLSTKSYAQGKMKNEGIKTQWRWYWKDDKRQLNLFEPDSVQHTIERKFLAKQKVYYFSRENYQMKYKVDFKSMTQLNLETWENRDLLRRPVFVSSEDVKKGHFGCSLAAAPVVDTKLPKGWVPWDLANPFELVRLDEYSPDYKTVADRFYSTIRRTEQTIDSIYRMQNHKLWSLFCNQEKIMEAYLKPVGKNCQVATRYLFHGIDSLDAVRGICINNFDVRVSGKNATMYGDGAYFARDAKYSHSYTKPTVRLMFMVKVLVGEYTKGDKSYRRPPPKPGRNHELFDSCVNDVSNPSIFIVFDKNQYYPEYLIQYKNEEFKDETTRASAFHARERTPNVGPPPFGIYTKPTSLGVSDHRYDSYNHPGYHLSPSIARDTFASSGSTQPWSQTGSSVSVRQQYPAYPTGYMPPSWNQGQQYPGYPISYMPPSCNQGQQFSTLYSSPHSNTANDDHKYQIEASRQNEEENKNQYYPEYLREDFVSFALKPTPNPGTPPLRVHTTTPSKFFCNHGYRSYSNTGDPLSPSSAGHTLARSGSTQPGSQTGGFESARQQYPAHPICYMPPYPNPDQLFSTHRTFYQSPHSSTASDTHKNRYTQSKQIDEEKSCTIL